MHIPSALVASVIAAGQLFSFVHAHVEMQNPPPFRSKFLQPQAANTDFSMTAPLNPDGSNFPCKGYQNDDLAPTVHLTAGSSFPLEYGSPRRENIEADLLDCRARQRTMVGRVNFRCRTTVERIGLSSTQLLVAVPLIPRVTLFPSPRTFPTVPELFLPGHGKITLAIGITLTPLESTD